MKQHHRVYVVCNQWLDTKRIFFTNKFYGKNLDLLLSDFYEQHIKISIVQLLSFVNKFPVNILSKIEHKFSNNIFFMKELLVKEQLNHLIPDKIVLDVHISKHLHLVDQVLEE
jgi:hypothetical protein